MEYWWLLSELISVTNCIVSLVFCCFWVFHKRRKTDFSFSCVEGVNERREREWILNGTFMYSHRFNCKPHMCTHTHSQEEIFKKKFCFEFSGKIHSEISSVKWASTHTQSKRLMTIFHVQLFQRKFSLSLENVLMKKPCVSPHPTRLVFLLQPFDEISRTCTSMLNGVSSSRWISSDFVKIFN